MNQLTTCTYPPCFDYMYYHPIGRDITIVPILVGEVSQSEAQSYASILLPYLRDPNNFWVISSDFCHWGRNFDYMPHDKSKGNII